jgi:uncharacterized membrane protein YebE (DUF533 family)
MLSRQAALIYAMVAAARADREITAVEIAIIGDLVDHLPIFSGIDRQKAVAIATDCLEQLARPGGIDQVSGQIRAVLSTRLREAAYALSCDVIAAGCRRQGDQTEALERVRAQLEVDAASARVIERLARLRSQAA